ncbi:hypothetical protein MXB_296 [Myxobolus squamalis]|nr:hypothetical protein MXB_296 [Myxobolus squamalis]
MIRTEKNAQEISESFRPKLSLKKPGRVVNVTNLTSIRILRTIYPLFFHTNGNKINFIKQ